MICEYRLLKLCANGSETQYSTGRAHQECTITCFQKLQSAYHYKARPLLHDYVLMANYEFWYQWRIISDTKQEAESGMKNCQLLYHLQSESE